MGVGTTTDIIVIHARPQDMAAAECFARKRYGDGKYELCLSALPLIDAETKGGFAYYASASRPEDDRAVADFFERLKAG